MPVPLRKFGLDLHKKMRQDDLDFAKRLRESFRSLEDSLRGVTVRMVDDVFIDLRPNETVWRAKQRTYLSYYQTEINRFYDYWAKQAEILQKRAFFLGFTEFRKLIDELYPKKYRKLKEGIEGAEEFWKYHQQAGVLVPPEVKRQIDRLTEQGVEFNMVMRGEANESFKQFWQNQLDTGTAPGALIKTISPEHVKLVQREVLFGMQTGLSHGQVRDRVIAQIGANVADMKIRQKMEYNVMRIVRTSHQQAAAAEMAFFSEQNEAMVSGIMRVADGFPCMACAVLDGKIYPVGTQIPDHPNGMCVGVPVMKTPSEMGMNIPPELEKKIWKDQQRQYPTYMEKFEKLTKDQKRQFFGNDLLFAWWWENRKRIKLVDLVVTDRNGFVQPMTYQQAVAKYGETPKEKK